MAGTADDAMPCLSFAGEETLSVKFGMPEVSPPGSGVDGMAGVNKNLTKTTGGMMNKHR